MSISEKQSMVDPHRIRMVVKRSYSGEVTEMLGEILQNAQRAGATEVVFTTWENGFTVQDNGHGIDRSPTGWAKLIRLGESSYQDPTVEINQEPMGVGIHSLLASDQVSEVVFQSGGLELSIDPIRWWSDAEYYENWMSRLVEAETADCLGFTISVTCAGDLARQAAAALFARPGRFEPIRHSPAIGYEGILSIICNGCKVDTRLPDEMMPESILETTYEGNRLIIGVGRMDLSWVSWYGQLISVSFSDKFCYCLQVRSGKPVNPQSPTRKHIIADEALTRLHSFVIKTLGEYLFNPANRDQVNPQWVIDFNLFFGKVAPVRCPYVVVEKFETAEEFDSHTDVTKHGPVELRLVTETPFLLHSGVCVVNPESDGPESYVMDYGLGSFLSELRKQGLEPYHLVSAGRPLEIKQLWWKPGELVQEPFFYAAGSWGIGTMESCDEWNAVPVGVSVFAFNAPSNWDIESIEDETWVGTADPIRFLQEQGFAFFDNEHESEPYEEIHHAFLESLHHLVRKLLGNTIPTDFSFFSLLGFAQRRRIQNASFEYDNGLYPTRVILMLDNGQTVSLNTY